MSSIYIYNNLLRSNLHLIQFKPKHFNNIYAKVPGVQVDMLPNWIRKHTFISSHAPKALQLLVNKCWKLYISYLYSS